MSRKPHSDVTVCKNSLSVFFPLSHNMRNITLHDEAGDGFKGAVVWTTMCVWVHVSLRDCFSSSNRRLSVTDILFLVFFFRDVPHAQTLTMLPPFLAPFVGHFDGLIMDIISLSDVTWCHWPT